MSKIHKKMEGKYMKKRIFSLLLAVSMFGMLAGCSTDDNMSKKVELRDDPVKSSSDYANGTGNVSSSGGNSSSKEDNADSENLKIGFVQTANESGWRAAHTKSMEETFTKKGYSYKFIDGQGDQKVQIEGIESLINDGYDAIVLAPIVEDGWEETLNKAKAAGIPVIIVDRMVSADESLYSCWVGSDFDKEGRDAAQWVVDNIGTTENKNIVILEGTTGSSAQLGRSNGFNEIISKYNNYTVLASESGDFDKAKGKELMKKFMNQYDNIDIIVTQNDNMAYGVIEAIEENNQKASDYTIVSFDGETEAFKQMIEGNIAVDVECNPLQGPTVEELILKILDGETVEKQQFMKEGVYPASTAKDEVANRQY